MDNDKHRDLGSWTGLQTACAAAVAGSGSPAMQLGPKVTVMIR